MSDPQEMIRTKQPAGEPDADEVARLRKTLYEAEAARAETAKACNVTQAAYHKANDDFVAARRALLEYLGVIV